MAVLLALTIALTQKKPMPKTPVIWLLPLLLFGIAWLAGSVQTLVQCVILAQKTDAARHIFISTLSVAAQCIYTFAIGRHGLWLQRFDEAEN